MLATKNWSLAEKIFHELQRSDVEIGIESFQYVEYRNGVTFVYLI